VPNTSKYICSQATRQAHQHIVWPCWNVLHVGKSLPLATHTLAAEGIGVVGRAADCMHGC
jgi:hypothetical protein